MMLRPFVAGKNNTVHRGLSTEGPMKHPRDAGGWLDLPVAKDQVHACWLHQCPGLLYPRLAPHHPSPTIRLTSRELNLAQVLADFPPIIFF